LHGLASHLKTVLQILGWDSMPGLVLTGARDRTPSLSGRQRSCQVMPGQPSSATRQSPVGRTLLSCRRRGWLGWPTVDAEDDLGRDGTQLGVAVLRCARKKIMGRAQSVSVQRCSADLR
jgi:hypothetical protein